MTEVLGMNMIQMKDMMMENTGTITKMIMMSMKNMK